MNIKENNRLIVEFVGFEKGNNNTYRVPNLYPIFGKDAPEQTGWTETDTDGMDFHCSWDWLMPIVKKITYSGHVGEWIGELKDGFISTHIDIVYSAIIKYIKWYNKEHKLKNSHPSFEQ